MRPHFSSWMVRLSLLLVVGGGISYWVLASGAPSDGKKAALDAAPPSVTAAAAPNGETAAPPSGKPTNAAGETWVPQEFATGQARFKDAGVYVDGRIVGVLAFGELPAALEPLWIDERVSAPKAPGDKGPGWTLKRTRRYRFTDYFRSLGVKLETIKEVHVYGAKGTEVVIASGKELRSKRGEGFLFRFGQEDKGKALPVVPAGFGNMKSPDKITAVAVYIEKTAPTLVRNEGLFLEGKRVEGIPYYGDPMRGGVRVYFDDTLAHVIKRRQLDSGEGNTARHPLLDLFADKVTLGKVKEAWTIYGDRRTRRFTSEELATATFVAKARKRPFLALNGEEYPLDALALHSKPVKIKHTSDAESESTSAEPPEPAETELKLMRRATSALTE